MGKIQPPQIRQGLGDASASDGKADALDIAAQVGGRLWHGASAREKVAQSASAILYCWQEAFTMGPKGAPRTRS